MSAPARALEFHLLGQPWLVMAATLSKISICLLFIRLLGKLRPWRILFCLFICLMAVTNLTFSLTTTLQCQPLEKLWNPAVDGSCWNRSIQRDFGYFQGAFSVFTWFFLALFPFVIFQHIRTQIGPRWPYYALSCLGLIAGVLATARTYETSQTSGLGIYTFDTFVASLLANLEHNGSILTTNIIPIATLFSSRPLHKITRIQTFKRSHAPSRSGSTRTITRVTSGTSSHASTSNSHYGQPSIEVKRISALIIEGARRDSFDSTLSSARDRINAKLDEVDVADEYELEDALDPEAWPHGIVKTVSVEVFEEPNPDHVPVPRRPVPGGGGTGAARASDVSKEQDWETMLRTGPPRT